MVCVAICTRASRVGAYVGLVNPSERPMTDDQRVELRQQPRARTAGCTAGRPRTYPGAVASLEAGSRTGGWVRSEQLPGSPSPGRATRRPKDASRAGSFAARGSACSRFSSWLVAERGGADTPPGGVACARGHRWSSRSIAATGPTQPARRRSGSDPACRWSWTSVRPRARAFDQGHAVVGGGRTAALRRSLGRLHSIFMAAAGF